MQITSVRGYALSSPIDPVQERRYAGGVRRLHKRDLVLVIVETADGTRGVAPSGASSSAMREYYEGESHGTFADVLNDAVAAILEGTEIDGIEHARALIRASSLPEHLTTQAIAAIDVALHDITGKRQGAPIFELLAERSDTPPTTELRLYASAGMYMEPDGYREQAAALAEAGFFGYKYRPGIGVAGDKATLEGLRDVPIEPMIDAHTWWKVEGEAYDRATVRSLVDHAAATGAYWVEEPVEPTDYAGYRELANCGVALAGGESEPDAAGLRDLASAGAVSFLQGDVRHHGGFTGCWSAIEYCRGRPVTFIPHHFGSWLGLIANAHLVAAAPETNTLEYPVFTGDPTLSVTPDPGMYPFNLAFDVLAEAPDIVDGTLRVPDGPGLGIDIADEVVETYPFIEGPWTEFLGEGE